MNKIIAIGLGNPGQRYSLSRHNVGFMVLDQILPKTKEWVSRQKPPYQTATFKIDKTDKIDKAEVQLYKPETFMNKSGLVAQKILKTNPQISPEDWFVIHDDLDIKLGQYKVQRGKGPKDHNGLISIYQQVHTSSFWHVRVGIDGRAGSRSISSSDYVLQSFSPSEQVLLQTVIGEVSTELLKRWQFN